MVALGIMLTLAAAGFYAGLLLTKLATRPDANTVNRATANLEAVSWRNPKGVLAARAW